MAEAPEQKEQTTTGRPTAVPQAAAQPATPKEMDPLLAPYALAGSCDGAGPSVQSFTDLQEVVKIAMRNGDWPNLAALLPTARFNDPEHDLIDANGQYLYDANGDKGISPAEGAAALMAAARVAGRYNAGQADPLKHITSQDVTQSEDLQEKFVAERDSILGGIRAKQDGAEDGKTKSCKAIF